MNDADAARTLYDPADTLDGPLERLGDTQYREVGTPKKDRDAMKAQTIAVARQTRLETDVVERIADLHTRELIRTAKGAESEFDAQAALAESRRTLRSQFGAEEAEDLEARVDKYIEAHPGLKDMMAQPRVRFDPDVQIALAEHVRRIDYRG